MPRRKQTARKHSGGRAPRKCRFDRIHVQLGTSIAIQNPPLFPQICMMCSHSVKIIILVKNTVGYIDCYLESTPVSSDLCVLSTFGL